MQFIRQHEVETLLKKYTELEAIIETLQLELGQTEVTEDDIIENMALRKTPLDEVKAYSKGLISDKTGNTALSFRGKTSRTNGRISIQIQHELYMLTLVKNKLDIGIRALDRATRNIIKLRYFDCFTWDEITDELHLSRYQAQTRRREGLKKLTIVCRISIRQYNQILEIIK